MVLRFATEHLGKEALGLSPRVARAARHAVEAGVAARAREGRFEGLRETVARDPLEHVSGAFSGAFGGGSAAWIGLGINAAILLLASLWLLVDLAQIDEAVAAGAPKAMEWMLAFGLIVTLAWVYLEALKLAFRIAALSVDRK